MRGIRRHVGCGDDLMGIPEVVREITVASGGVTHRIVLDSRPTSARRVVGFLKGTAGSCAAGLDLFLEEAIRTVRYLDFLRRLPPEAEVAVTAWSGSAADPSPAPLGTRAVSALGIGLRRVAQGIAHSFARHTSRRSPFRSRLAATKWEEILAPGGELVVRLPGRKRPQGHGAVLLVLERPIISADWQSCRMALMIRHTNGMNESILLGDRSRWFMKQAARQGFVRVEEVTGPWTSMTYEVKVSTVTPAASLLQALGCQNRL